MTESPLISLRSNSGRNPVSTLRTLLVLGRVSNLPTVWSNCLAGWLLGGGRNGAGLGLVLLGISLLYVGGMFLNDAFDEDFDRANRRERPIPSGAIDPGTVWIFGFLWLGAGILTLLAVKASAFWLGIALTGSILVYDYLHKRITFSPVLMAVCRILVYLIAAAAGAQGVTGLSLWSGLALGGYIVGLSYVARGESTGTTAPAWPLALMGLPLLLASFVNGPNYRWAAFTISIFFLAWTLYSLTPLFRAAEPNVGQVVSRLLAGIVWVDLLAVADHAGRAGIIFVGCFILALVLQRYVPAT